jgi:uncharacterized protein
MESTDVPIESSTDFVIEPEIAPAVASSPVTTYPSILQSVGIVGIIILFLIGCTPISFLTDRLGEEFTLLFYYVSAWGLSFAAIHSIRRRKLGTSTYDFRISSWRQVIPTMLATVALVFGVVSPIQRLIPMPEAVLEILSGLGELNGPATIALLVLAAPFIEELIFRGIMLDGLLKRYRPLTAIFVSSLMFGLVHLNPWQFVTGFVLGLFMGWVYYYSRSVGACIVIHMAANLNAYAMMQLSGDPLTPTEGLDYFTPFGGMRQFLIVSGICWAVVVISILYLRREFNRLATVSNESESMLVELL